MTVLEWLLDSDPAIRWQAVPPGTTPVRLKSTAKLVNPPSPRWHHDVLRALEYCRSMDARPSRWNTLRALRVLDWYESLSK